MLVVEPARCTNTGGVGIEVMSQAIATLAGISLRASYFELNRQIQALVNSSGACERLFNKRMRECDWREFEGEIGRILQR